MITFNFHIGDFVKKTAHLTHEERGIYLSMLMKYYDSEQPLPTDIKQVCRLVCVRNADAMRQVSDLLEEFFVLTEHGWVNKRVDEEIQKYRNKSAKAKKSAEARWGADSSNSALDKNTKNSNKANAMRTHSDGNANHEPITNIKESSQNARDKNSDPLTPDSHPLGFDENYQSDNSGPAQAANSRQLPPDTDHSCTGENLQFENQFLLMARTTGLGSDYSDADIRNRFDLFRCYKTNANTIKPQSEWLRTWRTWCQREKVQHAKQSKSSSGHSQGAARSGNESGTQRAMRLAQQAAERIANGQTGEGH